MSERDDGPPKKPPPGKPPQELQFSAYLAGRLAFRSTITGRYMSSAAARKHPKTTVSEIQPATGKSSRKVSGSGKPRK